MIKIPIPKPKKNEEQSKFISRCMSELKKEFPDSDQRLAICFDAWKKGKKESVEDEKDDSKEETVKKENIKRDGQGRRIIAENVPIIIGATIEVNG